MFCPSCGAQNERDSEKCKNCGKPLPKLSPTGELVMPATEDITGAVTAPTETVPVGPSGPKAGSPGSQYSFTNQPPQSGPYYNSPLYPAYNPQPYAPYYNYSLPVDQVGVAPAEIGFWPRLGAYVIDNIILSIVGGIIFFIPLSIYVGSFFVKHQNELLPLCDNTAYTYNSQACVDTFERILRQSNELGTFGLLVLGLGLASTLLTVLYYTIMTARSGATVGKKVFGIKVVRADGGPISFGQSLLRHTIGYLASAVVFALGFIWIGFDPHKQGWHDKIARTYVVRNQQYR